MDDNEKKIKEIYEQGNREIAKSATELQEMLDKYSNSTGVFEKEVDGKVAYYVNLADLHVPEGNMFFLVEVMKQLARIPNLYFSFGGDQINNSIKSSIGDTHSEVINGQKQVETFAQIILDANKEVPILDRIVAIESGNHENRSEKNTSLNPTFLFCALLGKPHLYAKNIAEIAFLTDHDKKPGEKVRTIVSNTHGENTPHKPTAQGEAALNSGIDHGADVRSRGHNHKPSITTTRRKVVSKKSKDKYRDVISVNTGAMIPGGEYADRANYPFPKIIDGQIVRITSVDGVKKQDFVNYRGLVNTKQNNMIRKFQKALSLLANKEFETEKEIDTAFTVLSKKMYQYMSSENEKSEIKQQALHKKNGVSNVIYFAPLSGFQIGKKEKKGQKKRRLAEIKKIVKTLSKLDDSCKIILNGDMIHYKKAITIGQGKQGEKFVEDTYAYIQELAEVLKPIKDKIIGINYGEQESKIMQYQDEELAEMALTNNQMEVSKVFAPYNKQDALAYQRKMQRRQVNKFNKNNLRTAYNTFMNIKNFDEVKIDNLVEKLNDKEIELTDKTRERLEETLKTLTNPFETKLRRLLLKADNKFKELTEESKLLEEEIKELNKELKKEKIQELKEDLANLIEQREKRVAEIELENQTKVDEFMGTYFNQKDDPDYIANAQNKKTKKAQKKDAPKSRYEKQKEMIQDLLVLKLRKENKLLSMSKHKRLINRRFPLESFKVEIPHDNLLANMLCDFMGIESDKIAVNMIKEDDLFFIPILDEKGKERSVSFIGSSSTAKAKRQTVEGYLQNKRNLAPGANVYYESTQLGAEFMTMDTTIITDPENTNKKKVVDTVFISAGTCSPISKKEYSNNRIYKLYARDAQQEKNPDSNGMYQNMDKDIDLYCDSLSYETAHLKEELFESMLVNMAKHAYESKVKMHRERKQEQQVERKVSAFENKIKSKTPIKRRQAPKKKTEQKQIIANKTKEGQGMHA